MAQTEDTELRDLVIEALEKNGSLAKIRALLRANIFLAFEDDYENIKQNIALDNILKLPEGILCLSIVYEFLEFCNLKNTLFVYKSESRQDKEYKYEGQQVLMDKLDLKRDGIKEPVLVSILKNICKSNQRHYLDKSNVCGHGNNENHTEINKDEQNCTYIVHEDSSCTSNSQSDNSSDEKTKLHLRLPLDHSDTDTSSDSTRDKSSSEYVPNDHILQPPHDILPQAQNNIIAENHKNLKIHSKKEMPYFLNELKITTNSSSDSTSYVELKPLNLIDEKLLHTTSISIKENKTSYSSPPGSKEKLPNEEANNTNGLKTESGSLTLNSVSSPSLKSDNGHKDSPTDKISIERSLKSDTETAEYSFDFSTSGTSKNKDIADNQVPLVQSNQEEVANDNSIKITSLNNSPLDNSQSSQSSVSISDVADLLSEKSLSMGHANNDNDSVNNKSKLSKSQGSSHTNIKSPNNDSGEFSESPVPSLSNLSLDIHSD